MSPAVCSICTHDSSAEIDKQLVAGVPYRQIATRYGVTVTSLFRHRGAHLSPALCALQAQTETDNQTTLVDRIEALIERGEHLFAGAAKSGQHTQALGTLRELRNLLELLGKADGTLAKAPTVTINLMASSEWLAVRAALLDALQPHPAARAAVSARLLLLEAGDDT